MLSVAVYSKRPPETSPITVMRRAFSSLQQARSLGDARSWRFPASPFPVPGHILLKGLVPRSHHHALLRCLSVVEAMAGLWGSIAGDGSDAGRKRKPPPDTPCKVARMGRRGVLCEMYIWC